MSKPVGGRGKKAPYEQTHVRVPLPIKDKIEELKTMFLEGTLDDYYLTLDRNSRLASEYEKTLTSLDVSDNSDEKTLPDLDNALMIAKKVISQKKSARLTVVKLLSDLYGVNLSVDDLKD
jgi:glutamate mutase epsilon subunit